MRSLYEAQTGDKSQTPVKVQFYLRGNVGSTSSVTPALDTGTWPAGSQITLDIPAYDTSLASPPNGIIAGKGGNGRATCSSTPTDGGPAIGLNFNLTINNRGIIGGGGGAGADDIRWCNNNCITGAGGGAGISPGSPGGACGYSGGQYGPGVAGTYRYGGRGWTDPWNGLWYSGSGGSLGAKGNSSYNKLVNGSAAVYTGTNPGLAVKNYYNSSWILTVNNIGNGTLIGAYGP
jgi:hypothetical protein